MTAEYTQTGRRLQVDTPLGADALLLTGFSGYEEVSRLFSFSLEMLSKNDAISAKDIVGKDVTFWVALPDGTPRYFHGYVSRFAYGGTDDRLSHYRAEVVPWLWFLTRTADCRIFQGKTVPQIIEQIFSDLGFSGFDTSAIAGSHPVWEYCVQYRETDFNFVSRLMEQEGIFYFFRHEKGKHTLVLADKNSAFQDCQESEVGFSETVSFSETTDAITRWEHTYEYRPGKYAQTDYNFETPTTSLLTNTNSVIKLDANSKYEVYDYPGEYGKKSDGQSYTQVRMEEQEVPHDVVHGASKCRTFTPGGKFKLTRHQSKAEAGKKYVVTSISHHASLAGSYVAGGGSEDTDYRNEFRCIPEDVPYRPSRTTPKPVVQGVQTAVVVGPAGEEIHTDKYGRVKVQFHWDREGKKDENSSCWVRVSSLWAGKGWGHISIPRIGQEVIVDFLEGDPDHPIITGRVYNADQTVPYDLPAHKTRSTFKTRSSKGGDPSTFNEIRFEDKKGEEELYFHAEKDQTIIVENDRNESVGRDRTLAVGRDKSEEVGKDKSIDVGRSHNEAIAQNMTVTVGANLTETVGANYAETVGAAMELTVGGFLNVSVGGILTESVGAAKGESVGGNKSETVGLSKTVDVGKDLSETIGQSQQVEIGKDLTESIEGKHQETVKKEYMLKAKKVQIVADDEISIKAGKAEIVMKKNGDITISGKKINVKGSGDVIIKGSKISEN